jgi:hypothetical protein
MLKYNKRVGATPQEAGRRFEKFFADLLGVKPVKGSGNLWYAKLDVGDNNMLVSCKHTDSESFRVHKHLMKEAQEAINGPGGIGGDAIPALAVSVQGETFVTLRAEDMLRLINSEHAVHMTPSKGEQKRRTAAIPNLLREE